MADRLLDRICAADQKIVVIDAAVLIDAGWDRFVHEVWTAIVPRDEAIKRAMERDHLSEELVS